MVDGKSQQDSVIALVGLHFLPKSWCQLDMQLYIALLPACLADTQSQPVCAITYPVNLASQGDF